MNIDWQTVFIIIIIVILVENIPTSIIIACLFLMCQYTSDMQNYNPNRSRSRVERFGNTHEYETLPEPKTMNDATSKGERTVDLWTFFYSPVKVSFVRGKVYMFFLLIIM
jgi:hypothetical protein